MINFAVIGRNFVVDHLIEASRAIDELNLRGVYSRNSITGEEYAKKHSIPEVYTSFNDLCNDKQIDFVYIASPNLFHVEQTIALLNSGKHVLCEKPMAPDSASLDKMLKAAEKNNRILMEAMMPAHMPSLETIRSLLPELGKIRRATLSFCQYSSRYDKFKNGIVENAFDPTLCNGSLMDIGVYCVHMLIMLFGSPCEIDGYSVFLPDSIDGEGTIIAKYPEMTAELLYSKISDSALPSQIQGEKGCLLIDSVSRPNKLTLVLREGTRREYEAGGEYPNMYYELVDFIKQIKGEKQPLFNEYSKQALVLMDKARGIMGVDFKKKSV